MNSRGQRVERRAKERAALKLKDTEKKAAQKEANRKMKEALRRLK